MTPAHLIDFDPAGFDRLPCCGIKNPAHPGRCEKLCWLKANVKRGLCARTLVADDGQPIGYIEYVPGEFAWRGVDAAGYMFIHCVWLHSKKHQGKGLAGRMVQACIDDAKQARMKGCAVVVRDGPWLADTRLFLANGFEAIDSAPPDYHLLARSFRKSLKPTFRQASPGKFGAYAEGLNIVRSSQCPYTAKFTDDITRVAIQEFGIQPRVTELQTYRDAQNAPTPYATFAVIYNGALLADHQISGTRFRTAFRKLLA